MRNRKTQSSAILLRKKMTDAERKLRQSLRLRQMRGCKFRRQYPVGSYIADFACLEAKLIVEVDGSQHAAQTQEDAARTQVLQQAGFKVLRFWNDDVLLRTDAVLQAIWEELANSRPPP